jgi:hypothetical protein
MKKKFEEKLNPLPLLLPHIKWRTKKKTFTCTPPPLQSKISLKKNQGAPPPHE